MKNNNQKGILIWITGLSGSGKTFIANKLKKKIKNKGLNFILINGDNIRKIFKLNKYDYKNRLKYSYSYSQLCKLITDQGTNIIITTIAMFDEIRNWNRKNIEKYFEIYIKCKKRNLIKKNKKNLYLSDKINVVGKDLAPQYPKNPDLVINNNFKNNLEVIVAKSLKKISKDFLF